MSTITKKKNKSQVDRIKSQPWKIVLHNDDFNTFQWVITCLVKICGHDHHQAEQCSYIVHYKGKCDVKYGDEETINEMKSKLKSAGLIAEMVKN